MCCIFRKEHFYISNVVDRLCRFTISYILLSLTSLPALDGHGPGRESKYWKIQQSSRSNGSIPGHTFTVTVKAKWEVTSKKLKAAANDSLPITNLPKFTMQHEFLFPFQL
jgi:hypothetical protein